MPSLSPVESRAWAFDAPARVCGGRPGRPSPCAPFLPRSGGVSLRASHPPAIFCVAIRHFKVKVQFISKGSDCVSLAPVGPVGALPFGRKRHRSPSVAFSRHGTCLWPRSGPVAHSLRSKAPPGSVRGLRSVGLRVHLCVLLFYFAGNAEPTPVVM